ncbi:MAG: cytochrome c oxidase subunit II [Acidobacteria bacterium]|nr:cytochrome c oxidase subunit II [Acidobacteriota bacterium]MBI3656117.1 cytochrome c oxidase subunit II [Acidobacteriota bacterium]
MRDSDGNRAAGFIEAGFLALLLVILIAAALWLFFQRVWWFPELASARSLAVDRLFELTLLITGIAFVMVHGALAFFIVRFRDRGTGRALFWHDSHALEISWSVVTLVILTVLVFMGQRVWSDVYFSKAPDNAVLVEVTGEQFMWHARYPGSDGAFGATDPKLITNTNILGLDKRDPAARDDVVVDNTLHLPVNRPARIRLRAKDVIHSFYLPHFRTKQDAVPGMTIEIWIVPSREGQFEIVCAELCGLGHYRMKAMLTVESQEAYDKWLKEQAG